MRTLQEHLDDLDRMVDTGADKPKIRHQIDLIGRIVATNEAEHSRLAEENANLRQAKARVDAELEKMKAQTPTSRSGKIIGEVDLST